MKQTIESFRILLAVVLTWAGVSCSTDDTESGSIELKNERVTLSDVGTPVQVAVNSDSEWRLEYDTDNGWLSTDLMGGKASTKFFTVKASANNSESLRFLTIRIFTLNGSAERELTVVQLSSYPTIELSTTQMSLMAASSTYKLAVTTNVEETDDIVITPSQSWIRDARIEDGVFQFTADENEGDVRSCSIQLEYTDDEGRVAEAIVKVRQAAPSIYNSATTVDFATAAAYPDGKVSDNIYVEGIITAIGSSKNMPANRYVIQNEGDNQTLVLESNELIAFTQFDRVRLALKDTEVETQSEGNFTYKLFRNLTIAHLLKTEETSFSVPQMTISQLTEQMNFCLVTLTDVEASINAGAYTNFKTCWPGNAEQKKPFYFVEQTQFAPFYRYYPVSLRDRNCDHIYMLSTLDAPWAHTTLPKGSGTVTGLVMRVKLPNFDIDETQLCIVPLTERDLNMDEQTSSVSEVIAERNCDVHLADANKPYDAIVPMTVYNPDGGLLAGKEGVVLSKSGNTGFQRYYSDNVLGYQDSFRGDVNLDDSSDGWYGTLSDGWYGRVNGGALNSKPWDENQYFYIDGISTEGISGRLSLQLSMNLSYGINTFVVEYASSVSSQTWTKVEGADFRVLGQFDRTDTRKQTENNVPGYKFYDIALPEALLGQSNICIRIRPISHEISTVWEPTRLDHVSLRYNK